MEISKNFNRYDSTISPNYDIQRNSRTNNVGTIKSFLEAFRIDLSARARASSEINDPSIKFPTYNEDVLQYNQNLKLIYKP